MEAVHGEKKKHIPRKLAKKRKHPLSPSMQYPERLQPGDDVQDDVTASKGKVPLNQSIFSMITAAGSRTDFHARFDNNSSDSDGDDDTFISPQPATVEASMPPQLPDDGHKELDIRRTRSPKGGRRWQDSRLARSLPKLKLRTTRERNYMSQSIILPPLGAQQPNNNSSNNNNNKAATPRDAPVMSRMLEAEAQAIAHAQLERPTSKLREDRGEAIKEEDDSTGEENSSNLAMRLKEIFGFENPEQVISEYPCWLLRSVLLQGYMYITENHICFYAYLPKKDNVVAKSGYLSKRGKQNPKHNRYWFTLRGDVLSYYTDPSDLYFPSGNIDLRYSISAGLTEHKDKTKDVMTFTVTTYQKTYFFKADSHSSAKEWVRTLQKVIFRSHNDGDSVKISLPITNVIDIEESPVIEFAETFKIRVFDSDETYAIDEYFFSFFSFGRDAFDVLRALVDDTPAKRISSDLLSPMLGREGSPSPHAKGQDSPRSPSHDIATPVFHDSVRATLSPISLPVSGRASPRMSGDWGRQSMDLNRKSLDLSRELARTSFDDRGRRSASATRSSFNIKRTATQSPSSKPQGSSDSYVHSMEPGTESDLPNHSSNETQGSASQILSRSDVFQSPTINRLQEARDQPDSKDSRNSTDTTKNDLPLEQIVVHPPSRSQTVGSGITHVYGHGIPRAHTESFGQLYENDDLQKTNSNPTLQQLVKAGSYPLQRAAGFAGFLRRGSKRMSTLLASESMGYVEKVSGMWQGGRRHYGDGEGIMPENKPDFGNDDEDEDGPDEGYGDRFRAHFALPAEERLQATYFGYLHRVLPLYGKIYISNRKFCFRSLLPGTRTKLVLPLKDIENINKEKGFRFGYSGMVVVIRGFEEIFFEFRQAGVRDDCTITLLHGLESMKFLQESGLLTQEGKGEAERAKAEHRMLQEARLDGHSEHDLKLPRTVETTDHPDDAPPILFDDPRVSIINFKPTESLRITCLTIGSRGDVQPYIALCKGFLAEGHRPRIATHAEFEPWVRKHGIDFAPVDGDPAELMRICVENGMFTYSFLREASVKFRGWIDELLTSAWKACQDSDLLIESPSAMAGIHIAEALRIPYFRAFTMPWTRTRAYPHAFAVPEHKMGGAYNYLTYVMFDNVFWTAIAGQVNRWRKTELGLLSTNLDKLHPNKVPFLYNFSPSVVVPPLDYSDWIRVTGYWFLDEASDWTPPSELTDFIAKARSDGKKLVYVGFGSIVVADPAALTKTVVESVIKADVRCILSKGWSDRLGNKDATEAEVPLPPEIHQIKSAPHDWLFKQIDAVTHHGGAGTTGASLRAGKPTIIKPFFGDQFFFGSRVEDLGVGICLKKLNVSVFSRALWEATHSERMIIKARILGEQIRNEDGVGTAIQAIYRDLEYARTLIKHRTVNPDHELADEESWTFIGDESDPDLARRIADWEPMNRTGLEAKKAMGSMPVLSGTVPMIPDTSPVVTPGPSRTSSGRGMGLKFLMKKSRDSSRSRVSDAPGTKVGKESYGL